jgi:hypothetical protein
MQYVNYEEDIVQRYGIVLVGWTPERFVNPSELSTALGPLRTLLHAINTGECKFIKLSADERRARLAKYNDKIESGDVQPRERKKRKDAGKKRKLKGGSNRDSDGETGYEDEDGDEVEDEVHPRKRSRSSYKSVAIIQSDEDE